MNGINMRAKLKGIDAKLSELIIKKWRYTFLTNDERVEGLAERNEELRKRNAEKYSGDPSYYNPRAGQAKKDVVFSKKAAEKLPQEVKDMLPKWPVEIILKNVYYNISDGKLFINFFSDIEVKK
jgi:hypothetical protein